MAEHELTKMEYAKLGRGLIMLLNRASMYAPEHPFVQQAIEEFHAVVTPSLKIISPMALIMYQNQLFVDEEPLDPRINVSRIVTRFKKSGIQSISFSQGLSLLDLKTFIEILSAPSAHPDADDMIRGLNRRGIKNLQINHVFYKKVTTDDEVITKEKVKTLSEKMGDQASRESKKKFIEMVMESVLAEELDNALSVKNLLKNPTAISEAMMEMDHKSIALTQSDGAIATSGGQSPGTIDGAPEKKHPPGGSGMDMSPAAIPGAGGHGGQGADTGFTTAGNDTAAGGTQAQEGQSEPGGGGPTAGAPGFGAPGAAGLDAEGAVSSERGVLLLHQLQMLDEEVQKNIEDDDGDLYSLTNAIFEMKRQLLAGIESQKAVNQAYQNEEQILDQVNNMTDKVLVELIRDEYQQGKISTLRMAQILRRLIPSAAELQRLLPKIKVVLIEEGMPIAEYLALIKQLDKELTGDTLTQTLNEAADGIGIDGNELIEEIRKNPQQAAELMTLAAEINKGTADEKALSDLLVNYVEQLGISMNQGAVAEADDDNMRSVMDNLESDLVSKLRKMNVSEDMLAGLEQRIGQRIESILDERAIDWLKTDTDGDKKGPAEELTILQMMERSVNPKNQLAAILKGVRGKADAGDISEHDFEQIYDEITRETEAIREQEKNREMPTGVLKSEPFKFLLDKEIQRSIRHDLSFATLAFSIVKARPERKVSPGELTPVQLFNAIYERMIDIFRSTDIVGELDKNKMAVLLPMCTQRDATLALQRIMKRLNDHPLRVNDITIRLIIAGAATLFQAKYTPTVENYVEKMLRDLDQIATRIKNVHSLTR